MTALRHGPYFINATTTAITVRWASDTAAKAAILLGKEGEKPKAQVATALALPKSRTHLHHDETEYSVTLSGLSNKAHYCYAVQSDGKIASATLPLPLAASAGAHFSALVFGDSGTASAEQFALFNEAQKHAVDFVLHTGDVAYPDGSFDDYERTVFAVYAPLFARAPFFPSPGNHDDVTDNGAPFHALFGDPNAAFAWRSFDWGSAHFITLDSNAIGAEQNDWLQKDLAASSARFKVAYFHHPAYSSGPHGDSDEVKTNWLPLFDTYKVDLVLAGHDHDYERFFPLRQGARDDTGTLYITTGGGGAELYPRKTQHANSALFLQKHHFVLLDATDCRMEISVVGIDGAALDHASIDKCVTAK